MCPAAPGSDVGAHKDLGTWFGAAALGTSGKCSFIGLIPVQEGKNRSRRQFHPTNALRGGLCIFLSAIRTNFDGLVLMQGGIPT